MSHRITSFVALLATLSGVASWTAGAEPKTAFQFSDAATSAGLFPALEKVQAHGSAWGDVDGDGLLDLFVATFAHGDGKLNQLLRQRQGKFTLDPQPALAVNNRATGVVLADLDNDGDLDLYVGSMPQPSAGAQGCTLYRNEGSGRFTNISAGNGACPEALGGRSVAVLDYDGDALLDLLVGEDPNAGYNGSKTHRSRLFRNLGALKFADVTDTVGISDAVPGLGVAVQDVNQDGWPDFFLAAHSGGNRLFINDTQGRFREASTLRDSFHWPTAKGDNMVCGVTWGDLNRDGLSDVVIGPHFKTPWVQPVAPRVYLNRGVKNGEVVFEEITQSALIVPLPLKCPHVEIQDFDNDGWNDIAVSIVKFAEGKPYPIIYRNLGVKAGLPQFRVDGLDVNDYPNEADRTSKGTRGFYERMLAEKQIIYSAPAPAADYDNDGRVDLFVGSWWTELNSLLLHNDTPGGHWLQLQLRGPEGVNRMAIGSRVRVYPAGKLGQADALLAAREIAVGYGYASGQSAIAHVGLGKVERVDVEVLWPHGRGKIELRDVKADQRLQVPQP